MSAGVASAHNAIFQSEPKIYISKATLKLNVNASDYAWRTEVITPQQTTPVKDAPETEVAKKHVNATNASAGAGAGAGTAAAVTAAAVAGAAAMGVQQHKLPTFKPAAKPLKMKIAVGDFMHAERCHTENIENMNQFVSHM